jgi:hypothetical protein
LDDTNAPGGSPDFQHQLLEIRQDPQVIRFTLRRAGKRELAEDALQTAYYRIASMQHPERIINLRAYFLRVLRNEINGVHALTPTVPLDDVKGSSQPQRGRQLDGPAAEPAVDDRACRTVQNQVFLKRYASHRNQLIDAIPARSTDPGRYREVIYAAGKQVLLGALGLEPNDAAFPRILRASYPEYFEEPGAAPNTLHRRISRARDDIKALLQATIRREELY